MAKNYKRHSRVDRFKYIELYSNKYIKSIKYIIHDLKCTADQIIAMICLLSKDSKYIDCIGKLKEHHSKNQYLDELYKSHDIFLEELNGIENSFKHHFTNDIKTFFDTEESVVTAVYCQNYMKGFYKESDEFIEKPIREIIREFNGFLADAITYFRLLAKSC